MKITDVKATWVHVPIPYERQHVSDFGRIASFDSVIVKIDTDEGLIGWGEAKAGVGSAASAYGLAAIINRDYGPLLVGQDPRFILEYSLGANPLLHELVHEKFPVVDGQLEIPDRPGLGITVDEEFVERHARL
jgi:L-alanine-DL-glutamate epimerase-like enolase superfamily enzyme